MVHNRKKEALSLFYEAYYVFGNPKEAEKQVKLQYGDSLAKEVHEIAKKEYKLKN